MQILNKIKSIDIDNDKQYEDIKFIFENYDKIIRNKKLINLLG